MRWGGEISHLAFARIFEVDGVDTICIEEAAKEESGV
jgi:hypothetical protein